LLDNDHSLIQAANLQVVEDDESTNFLRGGHELATSRIFMRSMRFKKYVILFVQILASVGSAYAQLNIAPLILGQNALSTDENVAVIIPFEALQVLDLNDPYPNGFSMSVQPGSNYTVNEREITPDRNYHGRLTVPVSVNDGQDESNTFAFRIDVREVDNVAPVITGNNPLSVTAGMPITLRLEDLIVTDPDNTYPDDFTLEVFNGPNYDRSDATVTPDAGFSGSLMVRVRVDDGEDKSDNFDVSITVTAPPNVVPVIKSQSTLTTAADTPITLKLADLTVDDSDGDYPNGFTLTLHDGAHYTFSNLTITPEAGYAGPLTVPVSVNDGEAESALFDVTITVTPKPNEKPVIDDQDVLSTFIATPLTLRLENFKVTDADNSYPDDFTLKIYPGTGYSFSGTTITPNVLFLGTLSVPVTVYDGHTESDRFDAKIQVTLFPNVAPRITGQDALDATAGSSLTVLLGNLRVTDPDDTYPTGFTLSLYNGPNYTVNGTTINIAAGFAGTLTVPVSVNDGETESERYDLKIAVSEPVNIPPTITAQTSVETNEDQGVNLVLGMLTVNDPDNPGYPNGFTLKLQPPPGNAKYTINDNRVIPAKDYFGPLTVPLVVNDGKDDSPVFNFLITVKPVNDAPVLDGQKVLTTYVMAPIAISLNDLTITDPDNHASEITFRINNGANYTFSGLTVTPNSNFKGELKVNVIITDGQANTNAQVNVRVNDAPNVPPVIEGQDPNPFIATQNTSLVIELTKLIVTDPDNKFPTDFKLKVLTGSNYTVSGNTITPAGNFLGMLQIPVTVNDGTDNSDPFTVSVNVVVPSARPQIIGQKNLVMNEDETLKIEMGDLSVTDTDDVYPTGFKLDILTGPGYTFSGTSVTPARNLNGFLIISVKVTDDGGKSSDPYGLAILINPVDDAPVITQFETSPLSYEPGADAIGFTSLFDVEDVDNDYLSFAEIGIPKSTYTKGYDELLFTNTATIRGVFDLDSGKLSLIGYAPVAEYREAIRSVKYQYKLNLDETGKPQALPGNKVIYVLVHDGQLPSEKRTRDIIMETAVDLRIPAAFSPNNDTVNETWQVLAISNPQQCENAVIKVYDKRGVLLFESVGIEKQWDGIFNGALLPTDTYYYTVDLNLSYAKRTYRGSVTLVR